jgi:hypothetical protein
VTPARRDALEDLDEEVAGPGGAATPGPAAPPGASGRHLASDADGETRRDPALDVDLAALHDEETRKPRRDDASSGVVATQRIEWHMAAK